MSNKLDGLHVAGVLTAETFYPPANSINNASILANAGIASTKLQHRRVITQWLCDHATDFAATRRALHVVYGATGTLLEFAAGSTVLAGATTTVTIDLLKNGTTVLSATVTLTNGNTAYILETATLSSTGVVVGDVLEVNATISGTNKPKGVFVRLVLDEDAE